MNDTMKKYDELGALHNLSSSDMIVITQIITRVHDIGLPLKDSIKLMQAAVDFLEMAVDEFSQNKDTKLSELGEDIRKVM